MIRTLLIFCMLAGSYVYSSGKIKVPERLFRMIEADVNVTEGDALYKSQAAGYYTGGGGVVVRSPVKSTQFASAHIPQIQAGCGGIDIYTGGFSFISGKQLVETLQAIASNSAGFAFMLGLESVSPTICNTMRQLQSWSNTVNGIGINSCETAAQLVGSVWPANQMASQHICRTVGTNSYFKDYIDGRHGCTNVNNYMRSEINKYTPMGSEYNIAWEALMAQPFFKEKDHLELAEMYMTLVGTFIANEQQIKFYFSKAEDNGFLKSLLEGGKVTKYRCSDKEKCLVIVESEDEILLQHSWFARIRNTIMNIQTKIKNDEPLDATERGLLLTSRLPLFKVVNVLTAYHRGGPCTLDMDNLAEIVSWDVLAQVVNEAIEAVRRGCMYLKSKSMFGADIDRYLNDLERVRQVVHRYEDHAKKGIDLEMRLIQKMQLLEQQLNSEIMVN